jgi:hypothetical protein
MWSREPEVAALFFNYRQIAKALTDTGLVPRSGLIVSKAVRLNDR